MNNSPSAEDFQLLQLLAQGHTDDVVARGMGWTRRTLQRRLQRIFEKLGARSRFQAGILAQRAGWITEIGEETAETLPIRDTD